MLGFDMDTTGTAGKIGPLKVKLCSIENFQSPQSALLLHLAFTTKPSNTKELPIWRVSTKELGVIVTDVESSDHRQVATSLPLNMKILEHMNKVVFVAFRARSVGESNDAVM
jgi:hypothetical protein